MNESNQLQALREGAVFDDGDSHDVLHATGNDRVSFLHRITSGKLAGIAAGQGGRTLLLDVRGHVLASLLAFVRERSVRLLVAGRQGDAVAAGLGRFAIMDDVQIGVETELATLAVLGPQAAQALGAVGLAVPPAFLASPLFAHQDLASERFGALWIAHGRRYGVDGICVATNRATRSTLAEALVAAGTARLAPELAEAARIAAREPAPGKEITPERFPVEVGLGAAIDHSKGCYVGQETIVRMRDRGTIRKRLALLAMADGDLAASGDVISADGKPSAGQVTSVGRVPGEAPVALAILASSVSVGATVQIQHGGAALAATVIAESPPWG